MIKEFMLAFIPIFVAVDVIGVLPIFVGLTQECEKKERRHIITQSLITALIIAVGFILIGQAVFKILGITVSDFMIAGGMVLFCIAVLDVIVPGKKRRDPADDISVFPIGTPLIVGPAVLTTSLVLLDHFGFLMTLISILVNLGIVGIVFMTADSIIKIIGTAGSRALSKVMALLLAAIAVMMVRKGLLLVLG